MSEYTLHHGDCLAILPTLEAQSVDAVIADPPYNVGIKYASHDDKLPPELYERWCLQWFVECRRVAHQVVIFPGHGNLAMWHRIAQPSGVGCWYKPGNPARGGVFQFCEWEPFLLYGGTASRSDVIRATISKQKGVGDHPCPKPLTLLIELLRRLPKAQTILDPFMGSGTTGHACMNLGRRFIGIERDAGYFAIARERIMDAADPLRHMEAA